jgi:hypothetical protein
VLFSALANKATLLATGPFNKKKTGRKKAELTVPI